MTANLRKLVQILNAHKEDAADDCCTACEIFSKILNDAYEITTMKKSLECNEDKQVLIIERG